MEACRGCDGRKYTVTIDGWKQIKHTCSRCNGSGNEPKPSNGKRRFGRKPPHEEKDESEMTLEEQTRAFLAKHGL